MKEVWKDVADYTGYYQVSNLGQVRSIPRKYTRGGILKPIPNKLGYCLVSLARNGTSRRFQVHRLVMRAFVGDCPQGMVVNHLNGKPGDNRLENLEYCTQSQNVLYSYRVLGRDSRGSRNGYAKLTDDDVVEIRRMYAAGSTTQKEIATKFGICRSMVTRIVNRVIWRHIP